MVELDMLMTNSDTQMITTARVNNRGTLHKIVRGIIHPMPFGVRSFLYGQITKRVSTSWQGKASDDDTTSTPSELRPPTCHNKPELQTKHIKVITRQDIINGKYKLGQDTTASSTTQDKPKRARRHHSRRDGPRRSESHSPREASPLALDTRLLPPQPPLITMDHDTSDTIDTVNSPTVGQVDDAFLLTLHRHISRDSDLTATASHK